VQKDKLMAIRESRGEDYGPVKQNHESIGAIFDGILHQFGWNFHKKSLKDHPEVVTLLMSGLKHSRESFKHKQDNIDDAKNYLDFTREMAEEEIFEVSNSYFCDFSELTDEEICELLDSIEIPGEVECVHDR